MDGGSGERVALTLEFVEKLKSRVDVPIIMQDERLTTKEADEILDESGVKKQDRKQFYRSGGGKYNFERIYGERKWTITVYILLRKTEKVSILQL